MALERSWSSPISHCAMRGLVVTLTVLVVLGFTSINQPKSIYSRVSFARVVVVAQNGQTSRSDDISR